jgi:hypothetical protein
VGQLRKSHSCVTWSRQAALDYFAQSEMLDYTVLRPLDHVFGNWELIWDSAEYKYRPEEDSFADHINILIQEIASSIPPDNYHYYENKLAEMYDAVKRGELKLDNSGKIWINASTGCRVSKEWVGHMIEQSRSGSDSLPDLVLAASGRVAASMKHGISHFDELDHGHMEMLAIVMMVILFCKT